MSTVWIRIADHQRQALFERLEQLDLAIMQATAGGQRRRARALSQQRLQVKATLDRGQRQVLVAA